MAKRIKKYIVDNKLIMDRWDYEMNEKNNISPEKLTEGTHVKAYFICPECQNKWYGEIRYVVRYNGGCGLCAEQKRINSWKKTKLNKSLPLFVTNPELEKEWDFEANNEKGLNPEFLFAGSNKIATWICPKGHRYETYIGNRGLKGTGCTFCSGQAVLKGFNDLETTRPDLLTEWDYEENDKLQLYPSNVMRGSRKNAHWICPVGHKYIKAIHDRCQGHGCVVCAKESQTSFPEQAIYFYISKVFEDAINRYGKPEIDIYIPSLKFGIEYDGLYSHRDKKDKENKKDEIIASKGIYLVRIKEVKDIKEDTDCIIYCKTNSNNTYLNNVINKIEEIINERYKLNINIDVDIARDRIEIEGQYLKSVKNNSIASVSEIFIKEWDSDKNGLINPEFVSRGSSRQYYWICSNGHSYQQSPKNRINGINCPICQGYRYVKGHNDLETKYPEIACLWDCEKNEMLPDAIKYSNTALHWWKCDKGHSYQTRISTVVRHGGCLVCNNITTVFVRGINDLQTVYPKLAMEWDYEMNDQLPCDVSAKSNKSAFWICNQCGYTWNSTINNRIKCPECKRQSTIINVYDINNAELVYTFSNVKELCERLNLEYKKQHGNITMICQRKQKTLMQKYVIRYKLDDEFYDMPISMRFEKMKRYLCS